MTLTILLLTLINGIIFPDDQERSIAKLKDQYDYRYFKRMEYNIPSFKEISFVIVTYSQDLRSPALLSAMVENDIICTYGVFYHEAPDSYMILDINGDGLLDYKTDENYIPNWILFYTNIKRTSPIEFISDCNNIYKEFNQQEGPNSENMSTIMKNIVNKILDVNAYNRDLYYSLLHYTFTKEPFLKYNIMLTLDRFMKDRFGDNTSPLLLLYMGEALLEFGKTDEALKTFIVLKSIDKNSIVSDYYIAYITDKINNTSQNIDKFKIDNPNFWALK
jgi:hypothetical protein